MENEHAVWCAKLICVSVVQAGALCCKHGALPRVVPPSNAGWHCCVAAKFCREERTWLREARRGLLAAAARKRRQGTARKATHLIAAHRGQRHPHHPGELLQQGAPATVRPAHGHVGGAGQAAEGQRHLGAQGGREDGPDMPAWQTQLACISEP
jgi:hypothetical protein